MKNQLLIPQDKPKQHHLRLDDVSMQRESRWNKFSATPKKGEAWLRYPLALQDQKG